MRAFFTEHRAPPGNAGREALGYGEEVATIFSLLTTELGSSSVFVS